MHGPLSFGCNFSCKVTQDLAAGVADDERAGSRVHCDKFIAVQLAGGSIADPAELHFFAPARVTRINKFLYR